MDWLRLANLADILSTRGHSRDFNGSRAEYINKRIRVLAFAFCFLALLWVPIDYFTLPTEVFLPILAMRLIYSALYLFLGLWSTKLQSLGRAHIRLFLFLTISLVFYVVTLAIFGKNMQEQGYLAGYSFLPFLLAALLAIFPLSIIEATIFSGIIVSTFIAIKYLSGTLFSFSTFEDIWLLMLLAGIAMWAQLAQLYMLLRLYREATRDTLTGLVNRRVLTKWTEVEMRRAEVDGTPLSVLLFDLDRFKRINDKYGHLTGDAVLQSFAKILEEEVFDSNFLGRYGGEEFLAILPENEIGSAIEMAERIRLACHDVTTKGLEGESVSFTVSVGVSQFLPGEDSSSLLNRVDKCLYQAKALGRDQVVHTDG